MPVLQMPICLYCFSSTPHVMAAVPFLAGTWFEPDWAAAAACHPQLTCPVAVAFVFCFVMLEWIVGFFCSIQKAESTLTDAYLPPKAENSKVFSFEVVVSMRKSFYSIQYQIRVLHFQYYVL